MKYKKEGLEIAVEPEYKTIQKGIMGESISLLVRLKGGEYDGKRKNIHNTILFDISGSTADIHRDGNSVLDAMKKAVYKIHKYAIPGDTLTIIPFSDTAYVAASGVSAVDRRSIVAAIKSLTPLTTTNFYDALVLGLKEEPVNESQIILLSDGAVNTGRVASIEDLCKWLTKQRQKVKVNTIGFGMHSDMKGLREIAEATGGRARFALTSDDLVGSLSTMVVHPDHFALSDVKLELEAADDVVITSHTLDYDVEGDITTKKTEIAKLYPNEIRNLLFQVEFDTQEVKADIGQLSVDYIFNGKKESIKKPLSLPVKSNWKRDKERNKTVSSFLETVAAAELWLEESDYNDSFTCVAGTCVGFLESRTDDSEGLLNANRSG